MSIRVLSEFEIQIEKEIANARPNSAARKQALDRLFDLHDDTGTEGKRQLIRDAIGRIHAEAAVTLADHPVRGCTTAELMTEVGRRVELLLGSYATADLLAEVSRRNQACADLTG